MDEGDLAERVKEQEREIEFLRGEVGRLRGLIASRAGSVEDMLKRRGFKVFRHGGDQDTVRPEAARKKHAEEFYQLMKKYSFRLFLRDAIKYQDGFLPDDLVRYSSLPVVNEYTAFLKRAGVMEALPGGRFRLARRPVTSFGPTLEWFVAEVFRREFMVDALWGVRFRNTGTGGDYDLLAAVEGRLLYGEVKSSPPKQIYDTEIKAYIERYLELSPDLSLFIMDTELRMKDKIVPMFEQELPETRLKGLAVERLKGELFHIDGRIFIINSKDSLTANIGHVLGWYLKRSQYAG